MALIPTLYTYGKRVLSESRVLLKYIKCYLKFIKCNINGKKRKKKKKRSQIQLIEPIEVKQLFVLIPPPQKKTSTWRCSCKVHEYTLITCPD